ncbi:helix-turn-helix domain-containing protein [Mycolicibacterium nivoides]|uniref:helix-turn-helix domain-containing protein n=1 Tax=Mycolicibacterium nivoides TaxID=2487344 RepID=UPI0013DDB22E|nr:helix-turn-helix domain-containing protein [Mycolicibacterium nivoides]
MRMLSVPELSERLDVCPNTVRAMLKRQDLPSIRIGGRYYRVREADLEAFMAGGTAPANAA